MLNDEEERIAGQHMNMRRIQDSSIHRDCCCVYTCNCLNITQINWILEHQQSG
jgi:hypothetical protein